MAIYYRRSMRDRFLRWRSQWRRFWRLLYMSPAEARFIYVMGGIVLTVPIIRSLRTGFPLSIVLSMGELKREMVRREVRCGRYWADFCVVTPFYRKIVEIDGSAFHSSRMDIVKDQERDEYLRARGYQVMRIQARRLWREPVRVKSEVLRFLEE